MIKVNGGHVILRGTSASLGAELAVACKTFLDANINEGISRAAAVSLLQLCVNLAVGEEKGAAENV